MSEFRQARIEKLAAIRALGVDPFGSRFDGTVPIAEFKTSHDPEGDRETVRIAGRIAAIRGHGKAGFLDVTDRTGKLQVYVKKDLISDTEFAVYKLLDLADIIGVEGTLFTTRTGELTLQAAHLVILSKALQPPPEKWHGLKDVELRYRRRSVDLFTNRDSLEVFLKRTKIVKALRRHLDDAGFLEVETPMMQAVAGGAVAKPFVTHHNALDMKLYMRIALELYLKRLLVGGLERVYELGRVLRNEGISATHQPEFTMLEVYQAYADYDVMMDLAQELVLAGVAAVGEGMKLPYGDVEIDYTPPWPRRTYRELFEEHAGVSMDDMEAVRKLARQHAVTVVDVPDHIVTDDVFERTVEQHLVNPTFVIDFPRELTPLARTKAGDPALVEQFDLYIGRMEVSPAYSELNDPLEQRARFEAQLDRVDEELRELDEGFLLALEHGMPPAGGMGLGVDRLVMLLTGCRNVRDVVFFPLLRRSP